MLRVIYRRASHAGPSGPRCFARIKNSNINILDKYGKFGPGPTEANIYMSLKLIYISYTTLILLDILFNNYNWQEIYYRPLYPIYIFMGRICMGRLCYESSLSWAEFVIGWVVQLPLTRALCH